MKKVLIVDDELEVRILVATVLGDEYETLFAEDSADALVLAEAARPDVIVLDVMMPGGGDGFQTFCKLKKKSETRHIPVIMLSSINEAMGVTFGVSSMDRNLGDAPAAFLDKPVKPYQLLTAVGDALRTA